MVGGVSEYVRMFVRTLSNLPADVIIASVVINVLGLALPLAILQVYDRVIHNAATTTLLFLVLCVCVALFFEAIVRILRSQLIAWSAMKEAWTANVDAASRVALAPARVVDREPAAYWMQRLQAVNTVSEFKLSPSLHAIVDLPFALIFLGLLFAISPILATVPLALFVLFMVQAFGRGRELRAATIGRAHAEAGVRDFLVEVLNNIVTVKAFAMEQQVLRRFERLAEQASGCNYNLMRLTDDAQSLGSLTSTLTQLSTITAGAILAINGHLTIGALACCTMLSGRVMQPLMRVASAWNEIHAVLVASDTAKPIFDLPAGNRVKPSEGVTRPRPARVIFDDVTFRYDGEGTPVLDGASLTVEPGEIIAITGANGSGRSTAALLTLGKIVPQTGQVLIDADSAALAETGACGVVAFVDHHVTTIRGTVLNNLTMFRDGEGIQSAEAVASLMGLEDDIKHLPRGYDTRLGEAATETLPPGLMQRIVVARAVASRPRLLIIDQADSSFDQRGDRMLAKGLSGLKGDVTTILITNHPSLIAIADRVVTISHGRFVEISDRAAVSATTPIT